MNNVPKITLLLSLVIMGSVSTPQDRKGQGNSSKSAVDQLFIYQGAYDSIGTVDEIARLAARHDYVVFTHGFYLDGSRWLHGNCLDVNYSKMPELLVKVRENNPKIRMFVYVSATADHPNGCWPQPSVKMSECPEGHCADFRTWTNLWLNMEHDYDAIAIDGIFIDLVHPSLIGTSVRDSIFSYVKSKGKLIMANVLSDTLGLRFAASSTFLQPDDYLFIEGYYLLAGNPNLQTEAMNLHLQKMNNHWVALVTEASGSILMCDSDNMTKAYDMFMQYGGSAFAYQSADLGTQTGTWVFCPNDGVPTTVDSRGVQTIPQDAILDQNYPNPANPLAAIRYGLRQKSAVRLFVFNTLGQQVATLVEGDQEAGYHEVKFDGTGFSSGVYFYRLKVHHIDGGQAPIESGQAGDFVQTRKLLLLR